MSDDESMLSNLSRLIPGYGAYREQESRREDDRRTRQFLTKRLGDCKARLDAVGKQAVNRGDLETPAAMEAIRSQIDRAQSRVAAAVEGYASWFGSRQVDADLLEEIARLDGNLVSLVDQIDELAKSLLDADRPGSGELNEAVDLLHARLDRRTEMLQSGS